MPLTNAEIISAGMPRAIQLFRELRAALDPDGPGGKRLTVKERRRLLKLVGELAVSVGLDIAD